MFVPVLHLIFVHQYIVALITNCFQAINVRSINSLCEMGQVGYVCVWSSKVCLILSESCPHREKYNISIDLGTGLTAFCGDICLLFCFCGGGESFVVVAAAGGGGGGLVGLFEGVVWFCCCCCCCFRRHFVIIYISCLFVVGFLFFVCLCFLLFIYLFCFVSCDFVV